MRKERATHRRIDTPSALEGPNLPRISPYCTMTAALPRRKRAAIIQPGKIGANVICSQFIGSGAS
jgi:hypothetical protein